MKKRLSLHDKAMLAMRQAVRGAIESHKKANLPLAIWDEKNQKVKLVSPKTALKIFNKGQK